MTRSSLGLLPVIIHKILTELCTLIDMVFYQSHENESKESDQMFGHQQDQAWP